MQAVLENRIMKALSHEEILNLFNNHNIDKDWSFEGLSRTETGKWTHNYHRYPAKFIPQIVEKLIDEYIEAKNAHINDPFMGCGTTIVTAISRGFQASGTDINKIAELITQVKARPINPLYLSGKIEEIIHIVKDISIDQNNIF